jgi:hypothetical protein
MLLLGVLKTYDVQLMRGIPSSKNIVPTTNLALNTDLLFYTVACMIMADNNTQHIYETPEHLNPPPPLNAERVLRALATFVF